MTERAGPAKSDDAYRTISEVADELKLPQHVLRFWETRFPQIKPLKRRGRAPLLPARGHRPAAGHQDPALWPGLHDQGRAAHAAGAWPPGRDGDAVARGRGGASPAASGRRDRHEGRRPRCRRRAGRGGHRAHRIGPSGTAALVGAHPVGGPNRRPAGAAPGGPSRPVGVFQAHRRSISHPELKGGSRTAAVRGIGKATIEIAHHFAAIVGVDPAGWHDSCCRIALSGQN